MDILLGLGLVCVVVACISYALDRKASEPIAGKAPPPEVRDAREEYRW